MGIPLLRMMIRDREPVTIEQVLDHFDHVVRLLGVEHVGVGSDMDVVENPNPVNGPPVIETPNWERYRLHRDEAGRITIAGLDHPRRMYDLAEGVSRLHAWGLHPAPRLNRAGTAAGAPPAAERESRSRAPRTWRRSRS